MAQSEIKKSTLDREVQFQFLDSNEHGRTGKASSTYSNCSDVDGVDADVGYDLFLQAEREHIGDTDEKEWMIRSKLVARKIDVHVLPIM